MIRIERLSEQIREHTYKWNSDICLKLRQSREDDWNLLCVSMDTLDDTCLALEDYELNGLGKNDGENYLRLYGVFQSIFLQQDAICHLHALFVGSEFEAPVKSKWKEIRELRNLTIGHPMKMTRATETRRCFISRAAIGDNQFQFLIWNKEKQKDEFLTVNFGHFFDAYKLEAIVVLERVYQSEIELFPKLID